MLKKIIKNQTLLDNSYFINGEWIDNIEKRFSVINPATDEVIAKMPTCDKTQTKQAIDAAYDCFSSLKNSIAEDRANILLKWFDLLNENINDLATIMTVEQGKPLAEAKGEITYAASFVKWFASEAIRNYGDVITPNRPNVKMLMIKQPIGVVGIITPWNFPAAMVTRKLAACFAAGCTAVIKPSEFTPLITIAMIKLAVAAGFPKGSINLIFGDAISIGGELTSNNKVRKISFTGSTRVGKILMEQSAKTMKKLSLELGGNAPFIVFDDADIDNAVTALFTGKTRNAGQVCVCPNRVFVQAGVYDEFATKLAIMMESAKVGNGLNDETVIGPLINLAAVEKVEEHINDAVAKGAKVITGGKRHELGKSFFEPTIITNIKDDSLTLSQEETFGPISALFKFETEDEIIRRANDTDFGLAGYFFTENMSRIWRVAEALEVGMVAVNEGAVSGVSTPFGGIKHSGLGREGSIYGIEEYLNMKYIQIAIK